MLHDWTHTGEKSYKCAICGISFKMSKFWCYMTELIQEKSHTNVQNVVIVLKYFQVLMLWLDWTLLSWPWNVWIFKSFRAYILTDIWKANTFLPLEDLNNCTHKSQLFILFQLTLSALPFASTIWAQLTLTH